MTVEQVLELTSNEYNIGGLGNQYEETTFISIQTNLES